MLTSESSKPRCLLLCVGSELLRGKLNTHASTIARRLASIGLELHEENTLGDEQAPLVHAVRRALSRFEIILVTGGLGPTFDDITREAVAEATGLPLNLSKPLLKTITQKFRRAKYAMPPANARQACLVEGAAPLNNPVGTAPGQWLELKTPSPLAGEGRFEEARRRILILLPGPPSELQPMLDQIVLPRLRRQFPALPQAEAHLHFVGVPESVVDDKIRPILARHEPPHPAPSPHGRGDSKGVAVAFTILAHLGLVDFDIFVTDRTISKARRRLRQIVAEIREKLGKSFYGMDADYPLEKVVGDHFRKMKQSLALAESCTGGMLSARLTDVPGSSKFLSGSVVTYSNEAKQKTLGVPADLLKRHGAVSAPVAGAMASGVRRHLGASIGLAITGIAGPGGATPGKPVGLVFIGLSKGKQVKTMECHFSGSRDAIRQRSVIAALNWLRRV